MLFPQLSHRFQEWQTKKILACHSDGVKKVHFRLLLQPWRLNVVWGEFIVRNKSAKMNFSLEILLPHLCQCMQRKHWLTLTKAVITSKWTGSTQIKQPTKITQRCAAQRGGLKLLLHREVCILNPLEGHYSSTVLFTAPINNNSQSPRVFHCPNLHEVWGLQRMWMIEVIASMYSQTHATQGGWWA